MTHKLTFVNGAKAACGCRHEFSSGGGEYSDVAYIHLCALHAGGAPVLDDRWKARMLDGRALERDEMGLGDHPELPMLDEGMMPRSFFAALGLELAHTSAEDQLDWDVLGAMSEAVNWTDWQPNPPHGDGWKLVSIFDTEDGPVAWWLRELPEAEDGTTTIRILQAEVEKLKARIARAGAAPAAVAGPANDLEELAMLNKLIELGAKASYAHAKSNSDDGPAGTAAYVQWQELRAEMGELIRAHVAPALAAPAAPATSAQVQALHRARRALHAIGKTYDDSELRTRALEADEEIDRMLAAAPQAPAAPVVPAGKAHDWRENASYGGEICAECGAAKGSRRGNAPCAWPPEPLSFCPDAEADDAARWRTVLRFVGGHYSPATGHGFSVTHLKAIPGADITDGRVIFHFTNAIDAAIAAQAKEGGE